MTLRSRWLPLPHSERAPVLLLWLLLFNTISPGHILLGARFSQPAYPC